ncbi:ABC transporter permease subunit [Rubritalea sp.]|uniref:ABC transporter permease subunit n=1 Tax=Rubritalea sp. TaxID=2109375 RepID=UPI003F4AE4AF
MSIPRGYISLALILVMVLLASLDQAVVGKRALYLNYNGQTHFPAFEREIVVGNDLGLEGELSASEVDYRSLREKIRQSGEGLIVMPLIPYDSAQDTVDLPYLELEERDGILYDRKGNVMQGQVSTLYDSNAETRHLIFEYRKGVKQGRAIGRSRRGEQLYEAHYKDGDLVKGSEKYTGEGSQDGFLKSGGGELVRVFYHAAPPLPSMGHLLGTTAQGNDLLAYLYGGLQLNMKAVAIYIPAIYLIGISIGLLMGFFGGAFDIIIQRIIEILSTIPFLFVVIIFSSIVPAEHRGLNIILTILIAFGWMGMTYLMRTAALKEKARDYVAAARVSGASTARIIFSHILPNTVAILVTLVPFSVSSVIMSVTALDYLGFGLPPQYATWGSLLSEGLQNLSKPWIVTSAFTMLTLTLILVTFVGEAVREAFDPKKFTTYK